MTDNEIIKALECCISDKRCSEIECPFRNACKDSVYALEKSALDLIKRLQWQVKRLKKYDEERDIALHARLIATSRAEAYKEFAERLKQKTKQIQITYNLEYDVVFVSEIDNLLKEMVGE